MKAVQRMLGHAKASMTLDIYADLFDEDLDEVADRLNDAIRVTADALRTAEVPWRATYALNCSNSVELRDSNPCPFLQKWALSWGGCSITVLRDRSVSCRYAPLCYAT